MNTDKLIKEFGNIGSEFIDEAVDYCHDARKGDSIMKIKKIAAIAACAVLVIGAAAAAIGFGNIFGPKRLTVEGDMTDVIVVNPLSFEDGSPSFDIEVLDPTALPFGEKDVILAVYGEFDISDSNGNFIAHVDNLSLNVWPYEPNVYYYLGDTNDEPKDGYVATGETKTELCVLRAEQEDGSWYQEAKIYFENVYYDPKDGEYYALSYDLIVLESGTYNIHINSLDIAYADGDKIVELVGDWTTTFTL